MNQKALSAVPITKGDLRERLKDASAQLKSVSWAIPPDDISKDDPNYHQKMLERKEVSVSVMEVIRSIAGGDELLSNVQLHSLQSIRTGLQIALHVAGDYSKRAGLPEKMSADATQLQITEANEKKQTAAAIALFSLAHYVIWDMRSIIEDNAFLENINVQISETDISRPVPALRCALFFLGRSIERESHNDDVRLAAVVYRFVELLQQEILNRAGSLKHSSYFLDITYQLEGSDFTVAGFDTMMLFNKATEINQVYPDEVIGNSEAVKEVEQAIRKLFLYDIPSQRNPIADFGGFQSVMLFSGEPGNGKTLILSVARTLARDYAEALSVSYRDLVVPNMVSKMQGESTDLARAYIQQLLDPKTINLGIGDEFEAVMPDHGGEHVSEGDKKVAVEFLKGLSGVSSVNRLNSLFLAATNYPENIDPAFMSRIKSRHYVTGAETIDDYIRFIVLNLRKLNKQYPGLVNLKGVDWNMDIRAPRVVNEPITVNPTASVQDIRRETLKLYDPDDIRFFAQFFYRMKMRQAKFSLRDCANTIDGAKVHVSGFAIPLEFVSERRYYQDQPIESKSGLISELAKAHVASSGIDFVQMMDQKAVYYAEEMLRMQETRKTRDVEEYFRKRVVTHLGEMKFKQEISA